MTQCKSFTQRLSDGETILLAEGYMYEFERRGYLQAGGFIPEVVLEHPEKVRHQHEDFVHAGTDIVVAFTYNSHREKLKLINREHELELHNRKALEIAKEVATRTGTLMAGDISLSTIFDPSDPGIVKEVEEMFKEQIEWINEAQADLIIAETFTYFTEAKLALDCIKKYSNLPCIIISINPSTPTVTQDGYTFPEACKLLEDQGATVVDLPCIISINPSTRTVTQDGYTFPEACKLLEDRGATVVGLNCSYGPETMTKLMREVRKTCKGPLSAVPVPFRTNDEYPRFEDLKLPNGEDAFPTGLDYHYSTRHDFYQFGLDCKEIGIQVPGICCGNSARHIRSLAEALNRAPPASRYAPDMSKHYIYGSNPTLRKVNTETLRNQIDSAGDGIDNVT